MPNDRLVEALTGKRGQAAAGGARPAAVSPARGAAATSSRCRCAFPVRRRGVRHAFEVEAPLLIEEKLTPQWKVFDTGRRNRQEKGAEFLKYSKFLP